MPPRRAKWRDALACFEAFRADPKSDRWDCEKFRAGRGTLAVAVACFERAPAINSTSPWWEWPNEDRYKWVLLEKTARAGAPSR